MRKIASKLLFSIGIVTVFYSIFLLFQTYSLTNRRVREVVEQQASMALKFDLAIRNYIGQKVRPLMYELLGEDEFVPETMSTSYVARSIFDDVRNEFSDYILKFSSDNPRNPANQAGPEELKVIEYLNNDPGLNRWEGEISIDGKRYMAKFSARRMKESCLRCHGDPKDAPASLLKRYGATAGFHRPIGMIIGLDTVAIPMATISEQLWSESMPTIFASGLSLLFFFFVIIFTSRLVITNRLTRISKHFVNAAQQNDYSNIEPIETKGKDEIFDLVFSFNTLSAKLKEFYSSLDGQVKERTRELADKNELLKLEIEERKRVEEEIREKERRLSKQNKTLLEISRHKPLYYDNLNEALRKITEASAKTMEVERVSVWLYNENRSKIDCIELYVRSVNRHSQGAVLMAKDYPAYFKALEEERTIVASDAYTDPRTKEFSGSYLKSHNITSMIDASIWLDGKMVGVVCHEHTGTGRQWSIEEENFAGSIADFVSHAMDSFERKQTEKEKKNLEFQLHHAQKMESIGTLAGGIAHDFNNILSSVIGYTELALEDAKRGILQHENLQEVLLAGNRAKDLVKQILTFSRQVDQEKKPVQVKHVVKEALKLLRASIPSSVKIEQSVSSNSLVMGDSTQIHQVLMNLCTNAAYAMKDDGGVLTVSLSDAELDSEFVSNHPNLKTGPYINLTVLDTGHGMSLEVMEKIFDPFFTTKEKGEGTGMGLSVVHGIVLSHGGDICVYSEQGKGSTFEVYLPVIKSRLRTEERVDRPIPTGNERILFIDDEPAIMKMGKQTLESLGYNVTTYNSSLDALELFKEEGHRFDLVITDMTMPHMTGEKLAEELMQIRRDIPVILCTGFSSKIDEKKALAIGIRAFISKPFLKREIAKAIRKVLDEN